jgi:hypothetical protein
MGDAGSPSLFVIDSGLFGDILELETSLASSWLPLVEIEFVRPLIGGKIKVYKSVLVKIGGGHTRAIVIVEIGKNVKFGGVL